MSRLVLITLLLVSAVPAARAGTELRDPTRPLEYGKEQVQQPRLQLNSILFGSNRRLAVINGRQVGERQQVAGATVVRILPDRVIVRRNGHDIELKLRSSLVQKNAT